MSDKRQQFRQSADASRVSSTSDVRMCSEQRQQMFARSPAVQKSHAGSLERVVEEPSNMADSSTDPKYKTGQMFHSHYGEHYRQHDGQFKKPAQQGYFRFPITPPYYDNRYSCGNPMCREAHYCFEHQMNRGEYSSFPVPPSPAFMHDCHANFQRQVCHTSPLFVNPNYMKRADTELPRPKPEWPPGYRPNNATSPSTPAQYLASLSNKDNNSIPPSTATSLRSSNLEPFMHPSSFPSPRQSARLARKRAMSSSPLSIDSIDINSLIRTSPDSLIAYINAPRLSSAGSYGHLSANGVSPSPKPLRSSSMRSPMFGCWQSTPTGPRAKSGDIKEETMPTIKKEKTTENEIKKESQEENMIVDDENKLPAINSPSETDKRESEGENEEATEGAEKDENNNEFLCLWKDCNTLFKTQDELVKHVNTDHIKKERRDFTCHWVDCQREQKPFKAQYMLVVHMRRHTGEKPNKCTYKGCNKAYSRLENLKTHERSHTGERPYVCEFENCSKAFTNASDRAKHQNRTHSSVKPYVCTVAGCTKRYTDPSSLRKHKKTCHPEHFTGAKKPKVDEAKGKQGDATKSSSTSKPSLSQGNQGSNQMKQNGDPSSPGGKEQFKETGNHQVDFSPQSFTSSSSCVDSPHSANIMCDEPEETTINLPNKIINNKSSMSPRSPQAAVSYSFPERPEMPSPRERGGELLVEGPVVPNQISLPTINKQNEVGKWIADVTERMSHVGRYPNEMKENLAVDYSSRRSSESGVDSQMSSRRSSEMSTQLTRQPAVPPLVEETPEEMYPPNKQASDAYQMQQCSQMKQWNNSPRRNEYFDDMARPSPIPDAFHPEQRRSSSGYGSHHNLAVIRSPVFHKVPIQNAPEPPTVPNRRMSDSIICEADSSNRYLPLRNNNIGPRRSSEPATHYYSNGANEFNQPHYPQRIPVEMGRNTQPLPALRQHGAPHPRPPPRPQPLDRGQKLSHYPYSVDAPNHDYLYPPHPPSHPQGNKVPQQNSHQKGLWQYEQHINQQLLQVRDQQQQNSFNQVYPNDGTAINGQATEGSYESMLNGMGNLNTCEREEDAALQNGPSNMVVNDMNTLLNSLIEENRYLEKNQEHSNMTTALSHIF